MRRRLIVDLRETTESGFDRVQTELALRGGSSGEEEKRDQETKRMCSQNKKRN